MRRTTGDRKRQVRRVHVSLGGLSVSNERRRRKRQRSTVEHSLAVVTFVNGHVEKLGGHLGIFYICRGCAVHVEVLSGKDKR